MGASKTGSQRLRQQLGARKSGAFEMCCELGSPVGGSSSAWPIQTESPSAAHRALLPRSGLGSFQFRLQGGEGFLQLPPVGIEPFRYLATPRGRRLEMLFEHPLDV